MDDLVIVEDPRVDVVLVEADSLTTVESTDIQVVDVGVGGGGASINTGNGLIAKVGLGSSFAARTLASLAAALSITNADGVAGNPTFNLVGTQLADYGITDAYTKTAADARYSPLAGSTSLVTVGTIVTGVWNAGAITSSGAIQAGTTLGISTDVFITREASNTVALRNSATAQTFRVYNTYTDASNYERGAFDWSTTTNTLTIGAQAAGTGTLRGVSLVGAGVTIASADNNNTTLPLLVTNSAGATIITTTGLGRVYVGKNSGSNVLFSIDVTGGALTGVIPLRVADSSGVLTIGSGGFGTSNTQIVFGANAFGNAIECVNPAGNGVFRMNGSNTTLGQTSLGGTPDKTLRVFNGVATTGVTSFRVRAGAGQSTNELAGVYANDDTTPYFRIVNGNTIVAGGLQLKTKSGALADGDFTSPADGFIAIDTTNSKLYARIGGTWKSVTLT
jgi:hypothetical protein